MTENVSYRYYLFTTTKDYVPSLIDTLASIVPETDRCPLTLNALVVRSSVKGQNAEFFLKAVKDKLPDNVLLIVSTFPIRTILGQNLPKEIELWSEQEQQIAQQNTIN